AVVALLVTACGGTTTGTAAPSAAASASAAGGESPAASGSGGPSPPASDAGYTGPPATITYSIWGDPQEIASQTAIADAFHAAKPHITAHVDVTDCASY